MEVTEVDIERDPESAKFVESVNGGNQTVPTMLFADGSTMCNPSASPGAEEAGRAGRHAR